MKLVKGMRLRIQDKKHTYFGYVSRIYKNKMSFEITSSNDKLFQKGTWRFEINRFQDLIDNKYEEIKVESYI